VPRLLALALSFRCCSSLLVCLLPSSDRVSRVHCCSSPSTLDRARLRLDGLVNRSIGPVIPALRPSTRAALTWHVVLEPRVALTPLSLSLAMEIHVLSFNINLLPVGNNPVGHQYKDQRLAEFLRRIDEFHVVALQEVFSTPFLAGWRCRKRHLIAEAQARGFLYIVDCPQPTFTDLITKRVRCCCC